LFMIMLFMLKPTFGFLIGWLGFTDTASPWRGESALLVVFFVCGR
jgi:hypothetical protein